MPGGWQAMTGQKSKDMDKDKKNQLAEIFFNNLGGMDNFHKAWKIIATNYEKVKTDTEQDFIPTLESMRAYLQAQGLILPKNFNQFWHWFVMKYSDELDEKGMIEITQEIINDFSRERTNKLKQDIQPTTGTSTQPTGKRPQQNNFTMIDIALLLYLNDEVLYDPRGDPDKIAD